MPRAAGTQPGHPRHLALDGPPFFMRRFAKSECRLFRLGAKERYPGWVNVTDGTQGTDDGG